MDLRSAGCFFTIRVCDLHFYLEVEKGILPLCPRRAMGDQEGWRDNLLGGGVPWWPGLPGELRGSHIGCWWHPGLCTPESGNGLWSCGPGRRPPFGGDEGGEGLLPQVRGGSWCFHLRSITIIAQNHYFVNI